MKRTLLTLFAIGLSAAILPARSVQPTPDDERRAAIALLRAINTAENATRTAGGKFVSMSELLNHPAMSRVKSNIAVEGSTYTYAGAGVRLALSADAMQYAPARIASGLLSSGFWTENVTTTAIAHVAMAAFYRPLAR